MSIIWNTTNDLGNIIELDSFYLFLSAKDGVDSIIHYGVIDPIENGDHSILPIKSLKLDMNSGSIYGPVEKLSTYVDEFANPNGDLRLFDGAPLSSIPHKFSFTIRAIIDPNNEYNFTSPSGEFSDMKFTIGIFHNWDVEKEDLLLSIDKNA